MQNTINDKYSLARKYDVFSEEYRGITIEECNFSVRVYNTLKRNRINTLEDLLNLSEIEIIEFRNVGKNSIDEILAFCANLYKNKLLDAINLPHGTDTESDLPNTHHPDTISTSFIKEHRDEIALGDFSFFNNNKANVPQIKAIKKYVDAFESIDYELAIECIYSPERIIPIISALLNFRHNSNKYTELYKLFSRIPQNRKSNKAYGYIQAFTIDKKKRNQLFNLCNSKDTILSNLCNVNSNYNIDNYLILKQFFEWCSFDLNKEIELLLNALYQNENHRIVIQMRSSGHTLKEIGNVLGITRERVRQIEFKTQAKFIKLHRHIRIISKICAERNGDNVLTPSEIELYCGAHTKVLLYLLKNYPGKNYKYDKVTDVFVVGDDSLNDRVQTYIETLPDMILASKYEDIINEAKANDELSDEMVEKAFESTYSLTGKVYHRYRLSRTRIYVEVIKEYFPDGIRIYDTQELSKFRDIVMNDYGDIGISEGDRALGARIASVCVLRGRGIYTHKRERYVSEELADKLYNYIFDSDQTIFMTNTIFNIFEDELLKFGINNKYYLQGVLRELYGDKLFFRRDYVSKDPEITSIYSSIVQFVRKSRYPVSKEKIFEAFPGVPEIVVALATSEHDILNYFGEYLHCSKLDLSENEIVYLDNLVENIVADGNPHHSKDIYEVINREKPELLTRNFAMFQFSAFSILEYLFTDKYQFSRPFIAQNGVEIGRSSERLREFVYSNDELYITDLQAAAKDYSYQIYSLIEYLNECNDKFLIADSTRIVSIDSLLLDEEKARVIEKVLLEEVTDTIPINQLTIWNKLPKVNTPWNEWLLYSVINKWGRKLEVSTSSNQFKLSVPLIAPRGKLDRTEYQDMTSDTNSTIYVADDLSDMDSLLEDMISDDLFIDL